MSDNCLPLYFERTHTHTNSPILDSHFKHTDFRKVETGFDFTAVEKGFLKKKKVHVFQFWKLMNAGEYAKSTLYN